MNTQFPRTNVGGLSLSRMIIGTNWLAGWSHTGAAADAMIREHHSSTATINPMLEAFMSYGVDTVMAPFGIAPVVVKAIKETEQKLGKKIYMVDTPSINVENTAEGRRAALETIRKSRDCDMVTCGCFSEKEALEDIEISLAALERRPANLGHRSSPVENQDAFGNN